MTRIRTRKLCLQNALPSHASLMINYISKFWHMQTFAALANEICTGIRCPFPFSGSSRSRSSCQRLAKKASLANQASTVASRRKICIQRPSQFPGIEKMIDWRQKIHLGKKSIDIDMETILQNIFCEKVAHYFE